MPYAFSQDLDIDKATYLEFSDALGAQTIDGLIVHLLFELPVGMRYIGIWENEEAFDRFEGRLRLLIDSYLEIDSQRREYIGTVHAKNLTVLEIFGEGIARRRFA